MAAENDAEKAEEGMLPGFRFHPTDEELVGFYLRRKVQKRAVSIELIRHLDIYKYDPWDLPKLAMAGEKEWYFYCPRDRKYRNSARPNRVTGAGFWKATGTDRAIYAVEGTACIGLKKSLVFYRGRAAKGIKTDWMMHEYRLPPSPCNTGDREISATDSWAICRIFKKTCSGSQRSFPLSWASLPPAESMDPLPGAHRQELPYENAAHESPLFSYSSLEIDPVLFSSAGLELPQIESPPKFSLDVAALLQCMQPQFVADAEDSFPSSSSSSMGLKYHHRHHPPQAQAPSTIDLLQGREGEMMGSKREKKQDAVFEEKSHMGDSQWGTLGAAVLPFAPPQTRFWERELPSLLE